MPVDLVNVTVTCQTSGCENEAQAIDVWMMPGGNVVCGVCGSDITPVV